MVVKVHIHRGLEAGAVTNRDVFEVLSLGENAMGYTGYPLVYAWLSGIKYRFNGARLPFTRVDRVIRKKIRLHI